MLRILKELIIYILIIALIVVVFAVLFYDELPTNKIVPVKEDYALPKNLENVLQDSLVQEDEEEVLVTYTVEQDDLDNYQDIKQYDPGKVDPFADYSEKPQDNQGTSGEGSSGTGTSGTDNSSNTGSTGGGKLTETKPGK